MWNDLLDDPQPTSLSRTEGDSRRRPMKYDQAGSGNYNAVSGVIETVNAVAPFGGFRAPAPNTTLTYSQGSNISVRIALTDASGKALTSAEAAPLAAAGDVEVVLTGPNGNRAQLSSA